ncbi:MAG TPA: flavin reductase family protein [Gemmatimonadales bacterium]|nr:flavin reductase family protein [Gemmatimonadales bacterium]
METNAAYELLRTLASPVCALTSADGGRVNGMILDSAVRASISPRFPRLGAYIHRWHLSHGMVARRGHFVLHLLHREQVELVHRLGFRSGREGDKLAGVPYRLTEHGVPLLDDHWCAFECRVVNSMDAGAATFFLADVTGTYRGPGTELLTAEWFRAHLPEEWRAEFLRNYADAQERIERLAAIRDVRQPRD